ncbi:MAG TPA: MMPL family transporter [Gaiellaceae bacterium]|nr:MMPL family transporter [Gaiellaceae bacterium]
MVRWTRFVLRHRRLLLVAWLVVLLAGAYASSKLTPLLSNSFAVPGTDSERVRTLLQKHFGDRPDGSFTVVFQVPGTHDPALLARLQRAVARAAPVVPPGKPTKLIVASRHVVYGDIVSTLTIAKAKGYTDDLLRALGRPAGVERTYLTGAGPIQHDLDPIFNQDLKRGELAIAVPIALLVLIAVFGLSAAVTIPLLFAGCTIMGTLGLMYGVAHLATTPTYTTNLIQLIGLGLAVDYSLLIVYRFREELSGGLERDEAVVRTMQTAGRAVVFSGASVALGLLLLVAMPLPFMRLMGIAGFLIPVVSVLAAVTLQPVLLSYYGRRGTARRRILPGEPVDPERGYWARLARSIMRRPLVYLGCGVAVLAAAAVPTLYLNLTPGSTYGIPRTPQSIRGFDLLQRTVGPGAVAPAQVLVEAHDVLKPGVQQAIARLAAAARRDPEVATVYTAPGGRYVDPSRRYQQVYVVGRHDYGFPQEQALVHRLRDRLVPAAGFPAGTDVLVGGGPGQGVDFLSRAYTYFPPLIGGVLVLTYFLLARAFRSLLLPLKAVLLNLLSVGAAYGMLVVVFKWGVGHSLFGLYQFGQVEGWIPIFLFAMLFGLSMDYEVFLVTRMRETWDEGKDNVTAVAHGLERTGRIITAAAVVMCAAFSGFLAGHIVGLQEFGLGLAVAILVDATIVRCLLVPSMMAVLGRWNWWLPGAPARLVRVPPSPLEAPAR